MDYSHNGFEFFFEIDTIRLLHGKYTHVAKVSRILDSTSRTVVTNVGLSGEVYGRGEQDARRTAQGWAKNWADSHR